MINNKKIAVHPKNEKQAKEFIQKMYDKGYRWDSKNLTSDEKQINWCWHGDQTCYYIANDIINYSDKDSCEKHKYRVIPYI